MRHEEPEDEIRGALTEEVRTDLPVALAGVRAELALPETKQDRAALTVEIGAYLRHGGAMMGPAAKQEYFDGVIADLHDIPLALLLEAIPRARKRIKGPWEMVSWVVVDTEEAFDRLKIEEAALSRLTEIAAS